jgi:hypothetical protein
MTGDLYKIHLHLIKYLILQLQSKYISVTILKDKLKLSLFVVNNTVFDFQYSNQIVTILDRNI